MSRESFRRDISRTFDAMSGPPSPALSARVRSALAEKRPASAGPLWIAGVAAGLIAAIVVGLLVVSNLNRHQTSGVPAGGPTASPSAVATAPPTSNLPAFVCGLNTSLSPPPAPLTAYVSDVRTGTHAGYDRITITFTNGLPGSIGLKPQSSTTFASGGGQGGNITIAGQAGILVAMFSADDHTAYSGTTDFKTGYAVLAEAIAEAQRAEDRGRK